MELSLTFIALFAAAISGAVLVTILEHANKQTIIKMLLAFSGGFLLSMAFIHFLPDLYKEEAVSNIGLYILLGFLVQLFLEYFSGGIEHGHVHSHHHGKIPWAIFIALGIHSFIEGIPLAAPFIHDELAHAHLHAHEHHHHVGNSLLMGILFHQVPVSIALMTLLVSSHIKKSIVWLLMIGFALTTPLGLVAGLFSQSLVEALNFDIILAIVVGMFLHISTTIIFETSENHKVNTLKLVSIIAGFAIAILAF
ncbi:MAG TPA: ZIP family metal transporter [Taishania sp.]|nr:ZIP family metal transporter [Taishania sp.]HNS41598.1 ZIP family metal transporter [Taishania sp.]